MKIKIVWNLAILLIGCAISVLHADEPTVVFQVNSNPPIWSEKTSSGGMGSEIIAAISKEMGIKTRIAFVPLKRLIADTTNNDVGNPLFYMNNQDFAAIIPIGVTYSTLFTYHKDVHKKSDALFGSGKRIGVLAGTSGTHAGLEKFGIFEESYTKKSLFKKLKAGRVDMVIDFYLPGKETIAELFPNEIDHFDFQLIPESAAPIALMIDSNYPDGARIGKRYQEGLHRIVKNGVYHKILEKYFVNTTIPPYWYADLLKFENLYSFDSGGNGL